MTSFRAHVDFVLLCACRVLIVAKSDTVKHHPPVGAPSLDVLCMPERRVGHTSSPSSGQVSRNNISVEMKNSIRPAVWARSRKAQRIVGVTVVVAGLLAASAVGIVVISAIDNSYPMSSSTIPASPSSVSN